MGGGGGRVSFIGITEITIVDDTEIQPERT